MTAAATGMIRALALGLILWGLSACPEPIPAPPDAGAPAQAPRRLASWGRAAPPGPAVTPGAPWCSRSSREGKD